MPCGLLRERTSVPSKSPTLSPAVPHALAMKSSRCVRSVPAPRSLPRAACLNQAWLCWVRCYLRVGCVLPEAHSGSWAGYLE